MKDEAIDEIRETRHRISAECGHDLRRYMERMRSWQDELRRQCVRLAEPADASAGEPAKLSECAVRKEAGAIGA